MKNKVNGNIAGIKATLLDEILALYDIKAGSDTFAPTELVEALAYFTGQISREISVYLSRDGRIVDVSIGDSRSVAMPDMRLVRNQDRLSGVRCIHTHPNGSGRLSDVDTGTLRTMKLDCMSAIGVKDGKARDFYAAYLGERDEEEGYTVLEYGPLSPLKLPQRALMHAIVTADDGLKQTSVETTEDKPQRVMLSGLVSDAPYDTYAELAELVKTAGGEVVGVSTQKKDVPDRATFIGSGKAEDLRLLASAKEVDLFVFDDTLSPMQLRNLELLLWRPVIDRTALILDIFASRAQTREGKLQVELAQLNYRLPRLTGQGTSLSRLGGGIGTRGPGEKKLEVDKRRIRRRIYELTESLAEVSKQRQLRREKREKNAIPLVALVGYTNAGKSTLLNSLSGSDALEKDALFATLDPIVRRITLPGGMEILLSDTVGFINKLPHELVNAFRATLEEVSHADLLLHVVDSASSYYDTQMHVVEDVLADLGAADTACINVYNKVDKDGASPAHRGKWVHVSAKEKLGLDDLLATIEKELSSSLQKYRLFIPYARYDLMNMLRSDGRILTEEHGESGTDIEILLDKETHSRAMHFLDNR